MRYIDPYKLTQEVRRSQEDNPHRDRAIARNHHLEHDHFINMIMRSQSEDVAPVIHARWEIVCMNRRKCSNCNLSRNTDIESAWNYCPRCGAKMDLEDKE